MVPPLATPAPMLAADDYLALVRRFPLVRIRDDQHLAAAHAIIDELSVQGEEGLTPGQMDYLLALGDLTTVYERSFLEELTTDVTGHSVLLHMVEEHGLTADDVGRIIGRPDAGLAVLSGKHPLTPADAAALGGRFHVPADLFLR